MNTAIKESFYSDLGKDKGQATFPLKVGSGGWWKRFVPRGAPNRIESNKLLLSHTLDELFSD
jgi:hypothetical protein